MTTATRIHAGDRPHDLTAIATTLPKRKGLPNLRLEAAAWRQLSEALAADPSAALARVLDIARALCHAGTAGLSLLKPDGANGTTVRWELVRGALASYEGLDTPLNRSPCGLCLDAGVTVLVSRPFARLEDMRPSILETLIAPLQDRSGRVAGTLWIAHHGGRPRCSADDARILEQLAQQVALALRLSHERIQRQQAEAAALEARRELTFKQAMIDEVNHRTKNTLHAAAVLLSLQARGASAELSRALLDSRDRLQLLADVHASISSGLDHSQTVLMPQLLQTLCNALKRSFGSTHHGVSLDLASDHISLPVDDAIAIALLSNETVTNAYKHAFSNESAGAITVRLYCTPERALVLRIADSGVGADLAHAEGGMGLKLIRTLAAQLHGTLELEGSSGTTGTRVTLTMGGAADRSAPTH